MVGNMKDLIIRKAKLSDLGKIHSMWWRLMNYHRKKDASAFQKLKKNAKSIGKKYLKKQIYNKNAQIFVVEYNSKLISYAVFSISKFPPIFVVDKEVGLNEIFVEKKFRKKGIAQKLIKLGLEWGKRKGLKYANLVVLSWNKSALECYKAAGFRIRRHIMKNY